MHSRLILFTAILISSVANAQQFRINVLLDTTAKQSLTGRLYVFSATDTTKGVEDPDPFSPTPSFYMDVKNWKPGEVVSLDSNSAAYPVKMSRLNPGYYKFGAILDVDTMERNNTNTPGNWYSRGAVAEIKSGRDGEVNLYIRGKFPEKKFMESDSVKEAVLKSKMLSAFHHTDIFIKAAVVLPVDYNANTSRQYPVVFVIPGWGGTHYDAVYAGPAKRYGFRMGKEKIYVYLNPETQSRYGLHSFVDSRVNGPWGKALVEEFIPYLESKYRLKKDPTQRFVMGQSSGGYGSLWLQLNYPKAFNGCWSVSPDPVDFEDFTSVNIYEKNTNMYMDENGKVRPFFLLNNEYQSTIKNFAVFENFLGDGGQMQAFDAEFGLPDKKGRPKELFNRETGKIDPAIAASWKPYDMGLYVLNNYKKLEKDLKGKVHVYAGGDDNFYLNGAVILFKQKAEKAKADLTAEIIPGANHWSIWSDAFTARVQREMDARIK